jgi:glycerophosphoryl diester phosphodiesterase
MERKKVKIEMLNDSSERGRPSPRVPGLLNSRTRLSALLFVLIVVVCSLPNTSFAQTPLIHAHAHNDYLHPRPLLDALDQGFCSVEADVHLVDGKLLVAHDLSNTKPGRTLQALYLELLRGRVKENGGRIFPKGPEFTLLIDLKSNWNTTYPALRVVLTNYADMLTTFRDGEKRTNAVLVVISGSRDRKMFDGETVRYAAFDGELSDLDVNPAVNFAPWISARWGGSFSWRGTGVMPDVEKQKLASIVSRAHEQGRRLRFWGAPDNQEVWQALRAAGVDLINTDNLAGLNQFLSGN